ncbi:hypothetical protein [Riemerella columbina]|uniref:hypothetical protein n=1 Tax=Riemerella columbina TaxID=103810 RepID=UPI000365178F|nr:hypothetical protein [Riemerella columbina]
MNKATLSTVLLFVFALVFSQDTKLEKLNFFTSFNVQTGVSANIFLSKNDMNDPYQKPIESTFTYGFDAEAGYQPLSWLGLSGGVRYSYAEPNYHLMYYTLNSYFFVTNPSDLEFGYITLKYGKQFNHSLIDDASFLRLGIGKFDNSIYKKLGQKFEIYIEDQMLMEHTWILSISYGITINSNKKL